MKFKRILLAVFGVLAFQAAQALSIKDVIETQNTRVAGTGCADARVSLEASNDSEAVLVIENNSLPTTVSKKSLARLSCTIAAPIVLPADMKLVVHDVVMEHSVSLPKKALATARSEVLFLGGASSKQEKQMKGPIEGEVPLMSSANATSTCGANTNLRINSALLIKNGAKKASKAQIKHAALSLSLERCP